MDYPKVKLEVCRQDESRIGARQPQPCLSFKRNQTTSCSAKAIFIGLYFMLLVPKKIQAMRWCLQKPMQT